MPEIGQGRNSHGKKDSTRRLEGKDGMTLSRFTYNQQKTCLYLANATPARFNRQWLRLRRRDSEQECRPRSVRPENWRFLGRSDERRSDASFAWIAWLSHGFGEEAAILSDVWLESEVCLLARLGRPRLSSHMLPNIWVSDGGHT
jgi:hypothetical protein